MNLSYIDNKIQDEIKRSQQSVPGIASVPKITPKSCEKERERERINAFPALSLSLSLSPPTGLVRHTPPFLPTACLSLLLSE